MQIQLDNRSNLTLNVLSQLGDHTYVKIHHPWQWLLKFLPKANWVKCENSFYVHCKTTITWLNANGLKDGNQENTLESCLEHVLKAFRNTLTPLPKDLLQSVFNFLPWDSLNNCQLVSKAWWLVVQESYEHYAAELRTLQTKMETLQTKQELKLFFQSEDLRSLWMSPLHGPVGWTQYERQSYLIGNLIGHLCMTPKLFEAFKELMLEEHSHELGSLFNILSCLFSFQIALPGSNIQIIPKLAALNQANSHDLAHALFWIFDIKICSHVKGRHFDLIAEGLIEQGVLTTCHLEKIFWGVSSRVDRVHSHRLIRNIKFYLNQIRELKIKLLENFEDFAIDQFIKAYQLDKLYAFIRLVSEADRHSALNLALEKLKGEIEKLAQQNEFKKALNVALSCPHEIHKTELLKTLVFKLIALGQLRLATAWTHQHFQDHRQISFLQYSLVNGLIEKNNVHSAIKITEDIQQTEFRQSALKSIITYLIAQKYLKHAMQLIPSIASESEQMELASKASIPQHFKKMIKVVKGIPLESIKLKILSQNIACLMDSKRMSRAIHATQLLPPSHQLETFNKIAQSLKIQGQLDQAVRVACKFVSQPYMKSRHLLEIVELFLEKHQLKDAIDVAHLIPKPNEWERSWSFKAIVEWMVDQSDFSFEQVKEFMPLIQDSNCKLLAVQTLSRTFIKQKQFQQALELMQCIKHEPFYLNYMQGVLLQWLDQFSLSTLVSGLPSIQIDSEQHQSILSLLHQLLLKQTRIEEAAQVKSLICINK